MEITLSFPSSQCSLPARGLAIYTSIDDGSWSNQNLALGKPVTTSSTVNWTTADSGSNLTDGSNGDFWTSQELSSSSANEWAYVDLGSQTNFQRVVLYPRSDNGTNDAFPSAFQIQGSNDASNWTTLANETNFPDPGGVGGASFWTGPQSYRYVRVLVTTARTDGANFYVQFAEMEIYNTPLSSGKTASASSTVNWTNAYGVANLTDGQFNDFWTSQQLSGTSADEWAAVDLGTPTSFGRVVLYPRTVNGVTEAFPSAFTIEGSPDGTSWTTLTSVSSFANPAPDAGVALWLGPQNYRYVRVHATSARQDDGGNYYVQFAEIEVY